MSADERKVFLEAIDEEDGLHDTREQLSTKQHWIQRVSITTNVVLLVLCVFLSFRVFLSSECNSGKRTEDTTTSQVIESYSPANSVIEYQYNSIILNDTEFLGRPGKQWENAMHEILSGTLIRLSEDEMKLHDARSIPLKDGGYAAGLGIGHNLHCVKKIKQFLFREIIYPNLSPGQAEFDELQFHADHCLDFLRQNVMCHLDYTLYSLYWGDQDPPALYHRYPQKQKCVNWDKVHGWMLDRAASSDMLIGPPK
ncbi:hypothetical protein F4777DRAFT_596650 [Nemania sp. FL0916]|nr:hypothetical protein F4777DRAFT_596650 [Nemania sp. FL0916]